MPVEPNNQKTQTIIIGFFLCFCVGACSVLWDRSEQRQHEVTLLNNRCYRDSVENARIEALIKDGKNDSSETFSNVYNLPKK